MIDDPQPQKIPLIFYRTAKGSEPVRKWLQGLEEAERHAIGRDLLRAQWRWPVGMPLCRPMENGLWEVRTDLPDETDGAGVDLLVSRASGGVARFHQENADHAGCGFGNGAQAPTRIVLDQ